MSAQSSGSFIEILQRAPAFQRQPLLLEHISEVVQDIRKVELSSPLKVDQRILALGLPSLQLIELKLRLEQVFAVEVPVTLFFEHVTLERLTTYLLSEVLRLDTGLQASGPLSNADTSRRTQEIALLSDAEAEAQLLRQIADVARKLKP